MAIDFTIPDAESFKKAAHSSTGTLEDRDVKDAASLKLASGQTWTPSGGSSGIVFIPKGTPIGMPTENDSTTGRDGPDMNPDHYPKTTEDQYMVVGDASNLLGKQESHKKVIVVYHEVDGKMVPAEPPRVENYSKSSLGEIAKFAATAAALYAGGGMLNGALAGAMGAGAATAAPLVESASTMIAAGDATAAGIGSQVGGWSIGQAATSFGENVLKNAGVQALRAGKVDMEAAGKGAFLGELAGGIGSSVSGWAKDMGASNLVSKGIGNAAGSASVAAVTGGDIGQSLMNSAINTGVGEYVGKPIKDFTGSKDLADIGSNIAGQVIKGKTPNVPGIIEGALFNNLFQFENPYLKDFTNNATTGARNFVNDAYSTNGWSGGKP